jgi:hypothetical protein
MPVDKTSDQSALPVCPYCGASVNPKRIERHKSERCPKAPDAILRAPKYRMERYSIYGGAVDVAMRAREERLKRNSGQRYI